MQERISFADAAIREYFEKENNDQCPFRRDTDRIIYSFASKLTNKTQVFPRDSCICAVTTRNSHSVQVSRTALRIAEEFGLCTEAVEAMSYAHDLGHPPYGHAGEEALNECMKKFGKAFNHDRQAVEIVEGIELIRPCFKGLNLTFLVRQSLEKRAERYCNSVSRLACDKNNISYTSFEGWILFVVDKIVYTIHDIEDSYLNKHITDDQLTEIPLIRDLMPNIYNQLGSNPNKRLLLAFVKKEIYNYLLPSLYKNSCHIKDLNVYKSHSFIITDENPIRMSEEVENNFIGLRSWMYENIYSGSPTQERDNIAMMEISRLFDLLYQKDNLMELFNIYHLDINSGRDKDDIIKDLIVYSEESFIDNFLYEHDGINYKKMLRNYNRTRFH